MQNSPAKPNDNGEVLNEPELSRESGDGANPKREPDGDPHPPAGTMPERPVVAQHKRPQQPAAPKLPKPSAVTIASFVLSPQLRGTGQLQTLAIPQKTGWVDLRLELEPNDSPSFRVTLTNQAGRQAGWRSGAIKAKDSGENKSLNIRIPAKLLKSDQIYTLNVSGEGGGGENFSNYSFKAVIK